jgi:hypothetical protein
MKRFLVALTALIASLAIGLATVSATAGATGGDQVATQSAKKKKKIPKIPSSITLTITVEAATTYTQGSATFSGQVRSKRGRCVSARVVVILRAGVQVAQTTTQFTGTYSVTVPGEPPAGTYTALARKKVFTKKLKKRNPRTGKRFKKKFLCRAAVSPPVTIP